MKNITLVAGDYSEGEAEQLAAMQIMQKQFIRMKLLRSDVRIRSES